MAAEIEVYQSPVTGMDLRTINRDGDPWFVAADACANLGHRMPSDALRWLEEEEKGYAVVRTPGGDQRMSVVNESGLYALIFRSKNATARRFRVWVTSEVLPEIRKTGSFGAVEQHAIPQTYAAALELAARQAREIEAATTALAIAEPKADAWDVLASAHGDYTAREAAFILDRDPAISTGQNRLIRTMRELGMTDRGGMPYAKHSKHLRLRAYSYTDSDGADHATTQIRITADGVKYLHKRMGGIRQPAFAELLREAG